MVSSLAWVDNDGQLHIGDLAGLAQRVLAQADADPTAPLVAAEGRVFWVRSQRPNPDGTITQIPSPQVFGFDIATGQMELVAPGTQVMASPDGTIIYVETDFRHLVEYWPDGSPKGTSLRVPDGWFLLGPALNGDPAPVIANGDPGGVIGLSPYDAA